MERDGTAQGTGEDGSLEDEVVDFFLLGQALEHDGQSEAAQACACDEDLCPGHVHVCVDIWVCRDRERERRRGINGAGRWRGVGGWEGVCQEWNGRMGGWERR